MGFDRTADPFARAGLLLAGALFLLVLPACSGQPRGTQVPVERGAGVPIASEPEPADAFLAALRMHCGKAFEGRVVVDRPASPDDPFTGKQLVMHVRDCGKDAIRISFHVGEDRSRTWVLTRTAGGLRLKHDHRHADGEPDAVTQYGGHTQAAGTANRQAFPVDAESVAMFRQHGLDASVQNTWALELEPGRFVYELSRPSGRLFQVAFDLRAPVAPPPPPWGAGD